MQVQPGVHQGSQIISTKLFSRFLALHQPLQKLGFSVILAEPWRRSSWSLSHHFWSYAVCWPCHSHITRWHRHFGSPRAKPQPHQEVPNAQGCILPQELGLKRGLRCTRDTPGGSGDCLLLCVRTTMKFLVSLWASIAVPAACCCSVLVVHTSTNVARSWIDYIDADKYLALPVVLPFFLVPMCY